MERKGTGKSKEDLRTDAYWVKLVGDQLEEARSFKAKTVEKQWLTNVAYYKGWQNLKYNTRTGSLTFEGNDPLALQINLVFSTVRVIRAAITKDQPKWEVEDGDKVSPAAYRAVYAAYMDTIWDEMDMKSKVKEAVTHGTIKGIGIWQYGFDADAHDGVGAPWVESLDPWDVYMDPFSTTAAEARYIIKVMRKPIDTLRSNSNYNAEEVKGLVADNRVGESVYQEMLPNKSGYEATNTGGTVLVHEAWVRDPEDGKIRVITEVGGRILRNVITQFKRMPFVYYFADINPGEVYGEGWVKNIIPINKAINYLMRSVLEYHVLFAKGRIITDAQSGIKVLTNDNGTIIRKPRGSAVEFLQAPSMTASVFRQLDDLMGLMREIGGAHEALIGRAPAGVTAGIAFEQLVSNAMNNLVDPIDNLQIALQELGTELLMVANENYTLARKFRMPSEAGAGVEEMHVLGRGASLGDMANAVPLPEMPVVKVRIGSGVAHTMAARQELYRGLRASGEISRRTLLEAMQIDPDQEDYRLKDEAQPAAGPMGMEGQGMSEPMLESMQGEGSDVQVGG